MEISLDSAKRVTSHIRIFILYLFTFAIILCMVHVSPAPCLSRHPCPTLALQHFPENPSQLLNERLRHTLAFPTAPLRILHTDTEALAIWLVGNSSISFHWQPAMVKSA